ncbi:MAG: hypothetical protein HYZ28_11180 [Myxococcales bacterium]|nr:hypothetical protein [Myxococcales bacterium]
MRSKRPLFGLALALLLGCPPPPPVPDAGEPIDAALPPPACDSPEDCKLAGFAGVCRQGSCQSQVPCTDDVECGLGESCHSGACAFTGCTADSECPSGRCRTDVFACTECGKASDCPRDRPVCDEGPGKCVQCKKDVDCASRGAAYCQASSGACVYCLKDEHCPNGLNCGPDGLCHGAPKGAPCPDGVACDFGLICVLSGSTPFCRVACSLYTPNCAQGEICLKLTFSQTNSLVFDRGEPLGICSPPYSGLKYYREGCTRTPQGQNCQPNLECVPDSSTSALCRSFCDPNQNACAQGEICHPFPGDFSGHQYGLCYADNGYGDRCAKDADCRTGFACTPGDDPSVSQRLSTFCHFAVGTAPALSPCAGQKLPDGGAAPPDQVCQSGACRGDSVFQTQPFFCFGACLRDSDCQVAGRAGSCDGTFTFQGTGVTGTVKGCRPACGAPAECQPYGASFTCRTKLELVNYSPKLSQSCGPRLGAAGLGEACTQDSDCQAGYCVLEDARGQLRQGTCAHPCAQVSDCASADGLDGGAPDAGFRTGPFACEEVALLGFKGWDGNPNTPDDVFLKSRHCAGGPCLQDSDCGPAARCVPVPSASDPLGTLLLRCRPPHRFGAREAGDPCSFDSECASGACLALQPPSTGSGKTCFMGCDGSTACPGTTTCRAGGVRAQSANGMPHSFTACAP